MSERLNAANEFLEKNTGRSRLYCDRKKERRRDKKRSFLLGRGWKFRKYLDRKYGVGWGLKDLEGKDAFYYELMNQGERESHLFGKYEKGGERRSALNSYLRNELLSGGDFGKCSLRGSKDIFRTHNYKW